MRITAYDAIIPLLRRGVGREFKQWRSTMCREISPADDALGEVVQIIIQRVPPKKVPVLPDSYWLKTARLEARQYFARLFRDQTPQSRRTNSDE